MACLLFNLKTPFIWWSGTEARDAAIEAATADKDRDGANRRWEHAMRVAILVLDDISQGKMTEAWSSKLFDLLETRLGSGLPTLWTSQITLPDLRAKIVRQNGGDQAQAEAISRRLAQHSFILKA
jgi:DNA replication protein DnaC